MGVKVQFLRGAWWIVVHHNGRRKKKRIGSDRQTAERVARALREKLVRGELSLEPASEGQTLETYAKRWLTTVKDSLKASTSEFYDANLTRHILPTLGGRPMASLRRADCRDLVAGCRAKGLRVSTVRGIARTLSTILTQAVEDELLTATPRCALASTSVARTIPNPKSVRSRVTRQR